MNETALYVSPFQNHPVWAEELHKGSIIIEIKTNEEKRIDFI